MLKLNESFSGEGNALYRFPESSSRAALAGALRRVELAAAAENVGAYFEKFARMGGVVEEMLEGREVASPSAQLRINPLRGITLSSTHEQVLGGRTGQVYLGCRFPAADDYRVRLQDVALRVARVLAAKGVTSRFSVDFIARRGKRRDWSLHALEINLRMGGTTHPMLALRFLTGGRLDAGTGLFLSSDGTPKYYRATDNLQAERYRGLLPEDVLDVLTIHGLRFSAASETGVLFHMIGAVSEFGKLGMVAIGNSRAEVEALYSRAAAVLDRAVAVV